MEINRHNYESYLIDYLEGALSLEQREEVELFLRLNPDIMQEMEGVADLKLNPISDAYPLPESLKREEKIGGGITNEFDYLCIANLEGDASREEKLLLETYLNSDNTLAIEYKHFALSKLKPDHNEIFTQKHKLKKLIILSNKRIMYATIGSVAALFLLLMGFLPLLSPEPSPSKPYRIQQSVARLELPQVPHINLLKPIKTIPDQPYRSSGVEGLVYTEEGVDQPNSEIEVSYSDMYQQLTLIEKALDPIGVSSLDLSAQVVATLYVPQARNTFEPLFQEGTFLSENIKVVGPFELIQMGVNWLAKTTGVEVNIDGKKDEKGELTRVDIETNLFALSVPVKRE